MPDALDAFLDAPEAKGDAFDVFLDSGRQPDALDAFLDEPTPQERPQAPEVGSSNRWIDAKRRFESGVASSGANAIAAFMKGGRDLTGAMRRSVGLEPLPRTISDEVQEWARQQARKAPETYQVNPQFNDTVLADVASGAGSLAPTMISTLVNPALGIATASGMMGEASRAEAEQAGASPEQQNTAFYANAAVGAVTEKLMGVGKLLKSAQKLGIPAETYRQMAANASKQALLSAGRESGQEGIQRVAENFIAFDIAAYEKERELMDAVGRSMLAGAIVGGPLGGAVQVGTDLSRAATSTRGMNRSDELSTDRNTRTTSEQLLEDQGAERTDAVPEYEPRYRSAETAARPRLQTIEADLQPQEETATPLPEPPQSIAKLSPIKEAAVRFPNGEIVTSQYKTHMAALGEAQQRGLSGDWESGFLTQSGEFLNAQEALERARTIRQIEADQGTTNQSQGGLEAKLFEKQKRFSHLSDPDTAAGTPDYIPPISRALVGESQQRSLPDANAQETQSQPTSTKNAATAQEREARGIAPAVEAARRDFGTVWQEAEATDPKRIDALIKSLGDNSRAVTDRENAMLLRRQIELQNEFDKAVAEVNETQSDDAKAYLNSIREDLEKLYDVEASVGTETGRGLNARKMLALNDFSLAKIEARLRAEKGGKIRPDQEAAHLAEVQALHDRIAKAEAKVAQYERRGANPVVQARNYAKLGKTAIDFFSEQREQAIRSRRKPEQVKFARQEPTNRDAVPQTALATLGSYTRTPEIREDALLRTPSFRPSRQDSSELPRAQTNEPSTPAQLRRSPDDSPDIDSATGQRYSLSSETRAAFVPSPDKSADLALQAIATKLSSERGGNNRPRLQKVEIPRTAQNLPDAGSLRAVQILARRRGVTIDFFRGDQPLGINGAMYGKRLLINIDAVTDPLHSLAGHEIWHDIQNSDPILAAAVKRAVKVNREGFVEYRQAAQRKGYDRSEITDEFMADLVGETLSDPTRLQETVGTSIAKRILVRIQRWLNQALEFLRLKSKQPQFESASAAVRNLEEVQGKIVQALRGGQEQAGKPSGSYNGRTGLERSAQSTRADQLQSEYASSSQPDSQHPILRELSSRDIAQFKRSDKPRAIDRAAIRMKDGAVFYGRTHAEAAEGAGFAKYSQDEIRQSTSGFVTNEGEFLNRRDAEARAAEMGQLQHDSQEGLEAEDFNRTTRFKRQEATPDESTIIGAAHIAKGATDFEAWSKAMREDGETPSQELFQRSQAFHAEIAKEFRTPEQKRLDRAKQTTRRGTEEYRRKVAEDDLEPKQREELEPDDELLALRYEREQAKVAYHEALVRARLQNQATPEKIKRYAAEILNTSRAIKTSFDVSAVLRQGGFIAFAHPGRAAKNIGKMFAAMRSDEAQYRIRERNIKTRPNYQFAKRSGLFISETGTSSLSKQEEAYMSRFANKIPGVGASGRAYSTFLDLLRMDSFDAMVSTLGKGGKVTPDEAKIISNYINVATGRGDMGRVAPAATALNTVFFAPRYVLSRFQLLAGQPLYKNAGKGSTRVRMMVAREYAGSLTGLAAFVGLGLAAGAVVNVEDPKSADFGKLRFGSLRLDPFAGLIQATVFISRLATGKKTTAGGKETRIRATDDEALKYGAGNAGYLIWDFLRSKFSPALGSALNVITGTDPGDPQGPPPRLLPRFDRLDIDKPEQTFKELGRSELLKSVVPISGGEVLKAMQDQGLEKGAIFSTLALFGIGMQVHTPKPGKKPPPQRTPADIDAAMLEDRIKKALGR